MFQNAGKIFFVMMQKVPVMSPCISTMKVLRLCSLGKARQYAKPVPVLGASAMICRWQKNTGTRHLLRSCNPRFSSIPMENPVLFARLCFPRAITVSAASLEGLGGSYSVLSSSPKPPSLDHANLRLGCCVAGSRGSCWAVLKAAGRAGLLVRLCIYELRLDFCRYPKLEVVFASNCNHLFWEDIGTKDGWLEDTTSRSVENR
jgi:hypothetical protein